MWESGWPYLILETEAKKDEAWIKDFQRGLGKIMKSNIQGGSSGEPSLYLYKENCVSMSVKLLGVEFHLK